MGQDTRFVGLDVNADTIAVAVAVAVAEGRDQVRSLGIRPESARSDPTLAGKAGKAHRVAERRSLAPMPFTGGPFNRQFPAMHDVALQLRQPTEVYRSSVFRLAKG